MKKGSNMPQFSCFLLSLLLGTLLACVLPAQAEVAPARPPSAKKVPHVVKIHDETLTDEFFWLRDKKHPEVLAYLNAENAYTEAMTGHLKEFHAHLYQEALGRIQQTDLSVPERDNGYYYY